MKYSFFIILLFLPLIASSQERSNSSNPEYIYNEQDELIKIKVLQDGLIDNRKSLAKMDSLLTHYEQGNKNQAYLQALLFSGELALKSSQFIYAQELLEKVTYISKQNFSAYYLHYIDACLLLAENAGQVVNNTEAERRLLEAIELLEQKGETNTFRYANALRGYSMYNRVMGKYDLALRDGIRAKNLIEQLLGKENNEYAQASYFLAMTHHNAQNFQESERLYLESQAIFNALEEPDPYYQLGMLSSLGSLYVVSEQYHKAEQILELAYDFGISRLGEKHPFNGRVLYWLGKAQQAQDQPFKQIENIYKKSLFSYEGVFHQKHQRVMESKYALANLYFAHGKTELALPIYRDVINYYDEFIQEYFNYLGENERESFYNLSKDIFEQFTHLTIELSNEFPELAGEALNLQLKHKSLLINTSNQIRRRIMDAGDRKLIELYNDVQNLRQILGQTISFTDAELLQKRGLKRDSLIQLLNEKDRLINTYSLYYKVESNENTWQSIQNKLDKKDILVEMVRFRTFDYQNQKFTEQVNYAAFVIGKKSKQPEVIHFDAGNFMEKQALAAYRNCIKFKLTDIYTYKYFFEPLQNILKKKDVVYFSPDGVFHQINLLTLYDPIKQQYVFDKHNIRIISSGRDLLSKQGEALNSQLAILMGNPDFGSNLLSNSTERNGIAALPATENEVKIIGNMLRSNAWKEQIYLGNQAREEKLKDMLKPKLLHIATHGYFKEDISGNVNYNRNPLFRSGLLLSGAAKTISQDQNIRDNIELQQEDGILTAYEAMNLNIDNTELVVLSACETGLGEIRNGEGVYGLQRALVVAGARSILMTLWKVDDESTSQLMIDFYENWLNGMDKRNALSSAQEKLKSSHPHPYFWGGFVLIGE